MTATREAIDSYRRRRHRTLRRGRGRSRPAGADRRTPRDRRDDRRARREQSRHGAGQHAYLSEVRSQLKDSGVTMFAIGLGTKVDVQPLQEFANLSGGPRAAAAGRLGARRRVPARGRGPAAPLRGRLHVDQRRPQRALAKRRDRAEVGASGHRSKCRRLQRPRALVESSAYKEESERCACQEAAAQTRG